MEIGSVRPVVTGVTVPVPRAPASSEQSVRTDLPVRAVVTEAAGADAQQQTEDAVRERDEFGTSRGSAGERDRPEEREVEEEFELDAETKAVIFKKIDVQSGDVVRQVPEEAMLRMRQLIHAWGEGGSAATGRSPVFDLIA